MISLACATRRPLQLKEALKGALDKADDPDQVQIVVRVDSAADATCIPRHHVNDFHIVGPRLGKGAARHVNQAAMAASGTLVMQFTDDQEVLTQGWDSLLYTAYTDSPRDIAVFQVSEGRSQLENPVVTRAWLQKVGCLYPPELVHFYSDTFVEVLAKKSGRLVRVPEVKIVHHKHKNSGDLSHRECREGHSSDAEAFIALRKTIEFLVEDLKNAD